MPAAGRSQPTRFGSSALTARYQSRNGSASWAWRSKWRRRRVVAAGREGGGVWDADQDEVGDPEPLGSEQLAAGVHLGAPLPGGGVAGLPEAPRVVQFKRVGVAQRDPGLLFCLAGRSPPGGADLRPVRRGGPPGRGGGLERARAGPRRSPPRLAGERRSRWSCRMRWDPPRRRSCSGSIPSAIDGSA
jgi:hypothetical protein